MVHWLLAICMAFSIGADAYTSQNLIGRGGVALDPLYGKRPSAFQQATTTMSIVEAAEKGLAVTEASHRRKLKWAGRIAAIGITGLHGWLAYRNTTLCRPVCGQKAP